MVFTKRNAIVGAVALKALRIARRARRRRQRRVLRTVGVVALASVLAGVLAGAVAALGRRCRARGSGPAAVDARSPGRDAPVSENGRARSGEPASAA